ncbi:unnamed protein product [Nezara viridula]|uniref:Uncharacterized protein n=1 Tax=Nezara viridula TaxID=85310 RepID=A0A9P0E824_NEZVI|nr:unnamed protein product [Nezara viridula]
MPSIYHIRDISPQRMGKYLQVMLHDNGKAPMFKGTWDYKKWAKDNAHILETEKRMHLNIQRLAKHMKDDKTIYTLGEKKGQWSDTGRVNKYSPMVKVGNWQEQRDVAEEDLNRFLRLRERGQLMIQKTREIIGQNLQPISMAPKKAVRFGEKVQLIARHAKTFRERGKQEGLSLSCVLTGYATAEMCQPIIQGTVLSASPLIAPCVRNVFQLLPWNEQETIGVKSDNRLKFGQDFMLRYIGTPDSQPYYVSVNPIRIVPTGNNSRHPEVFLHSKKCWANVWRAYNGDPSKRKETMGQPIAGGQDVILTSANINRCLCCETECWFTTFFGLECEATAYTYYNVYGAESTNNIWYFN